MLAVETIEDEKWKDKLHRVTDMVEKPKAADAPSPYIVVGRYLLEGETFSHIENTKPGRGGEIQLTDALVEFAKQGLLCCHGQGEQKN